MVHHPTIIAAHCEGRSWQFAGDAEVRSKFWGRYIELTPVGLIRLKFSDGDEYHWSKVGCPGLHSLSMSLSTYLRHQSGSLELSYRADLVAWNLHGLCHRCMFAIAACCADVSAAYSGSEGNEYQGKVGRLLPVHSAKQCA